MQQQQQQVSGGQMLGGLLYLAVVVGIWVWLGMQAASVWVGLLGFAGLITLQVAASRAVIGKFSGVFAMEWLGAWAISGAGTLAQYEGRWWWAVPWVLAAFLLFNAAMASSGKNSWAAQGGAILGIWSLLWSVVGPLWLYGKDQQETQEFFLDLLKDWWWVGIIGFVVLVGIMTAVSMHGERRQATMAQNPWGGPPGGGPPGVGLNPIFGHGSVINPATYRSAEKRAAPPEEPEPKLEPLHIPQGLDYLESDPDRFTAPPGREVLPTVLAGGAATPEVGATVLAGAPGNELYDLGVAIVDWAACGADHFLLTEDGRLLRRHAGTTDVMPGVQLRQPRGVSSVGDVVVAVDAAQVFVLDGSEPAVVRRYDVDGGVGCFAVNPYGTMVAYASDWQPGVKTLMLGTGDCQTLAEDVQTPNVMAFSLDGRFLALGTGDGRVRLFDMATRRVGGPLYTPAGEEDSVVALVADPAGGWLVGYASQRVAHWDAAGVRRAFVTEQHRVSSLALQQISGSVAVGCADGYVVVHPADLERAVFDRRVSDDRIVRVAFEPDGGRVLVASHEGSVRRAEV